MLPVAGALTRTPFEVKQRTQREGKQWTSVGLAEMKNQCICGQFLPQDVTGMSSFHVKVYKIDHKPSI